MINKEQTITIFDLETNGFKGSSVLSISALEIKYLETMNKFGIVNVYSRFYFPNEGEKIKDSALKIHGLDEARIKELRDGVDYPNYFKNDIESFLTFSKNSSIYVAHNIKFDSSFIPFSGKDIELFCTMENNIFINRSGKWPTLEETAKYYEIKLDRKMLHASNYDVYLCFEIFNAMYLNKNKNLLPLLSKKGFLNDN